MGVKGPLHWGGSPRWVAQAARLAIASVNAQRATTVEPIAANDLEMRRMRMGLLSSRSRVDRDSNEGVSRFTHQLRLDPIGIDFSPHRFRRAAALVAQLLTGLAG